MSKTTLIGLISALDYIDGWFPACAGMTAPVLEVVQKTYTDLCGCVFRERGTRQWRVGHHSQIISAFKLIEQQTSAITQR